MASRSDQEPAQSFPPAGESNPPVVSDGENPLKATYTVRTADGQVMEVPPEGTLGLLAAGYRGIMLWREARAASGWTPAKAVSESKAAFREYKQAAKPKPKAGQDSGQTPG